MNMVHFKTQDFSSDRLSLIFQYSRRFERIRAFFALLKTMAFFKINKNSVYQWAEQHLITFAT